MMATVYCCVSVDTKAINAVPSLVGNVISVTNCSGILPKQYPGILNFYIISVYKTI